MFYVKRWRLVSFLAVWFLIMVSSADMTPPFSMTSSLNVLRNRQL